MNVIQLGLRGFPEVQGGIEKHVENLASQLVKRQCSVSVIVRSPYMKHVEGKSWNNIQYVRLWAPRSSKLEAIVHSTLGVLMAAIARPDVLHIHGVGPALLTPLARLLGLRVVVTHHGPDYERQKWGRFAKFVLELGEAWGMKCSNGRIAISKTIANTIDRKYGVSARVIHNGLAAPAENAGVEILREYGLEKRRYVLFVSRFVPEKRHLDLIAAFVRAELTDWKLVLVGGADHQSQYVSQVQAVAKRTSNVVLTGVQTGSALSELYAHAGMFVLPSSHEGLPIVALEALSYGLPIIASKIPANLELPLDKDQYFPVGDIAALADLVKRFSEFSHTPEQLCLIRTKLQSLYDWENIAETTLSVYREASGKVFLL